MRAGHRDEARPRPGALSPAHRRAPREGPVPEMREAPARAASKPVRGVRREAAARRPRTVPPAHRRSVSRRAFARNAGNGRRAPDRQLCEPCNEKTNRASRARDARLRAAGMPRRDPERARRIRTRASPPRARSAPRRGPVHQVRPGAGRGGPRVLRAVPGEAPRRRPRELCRRQGGRAEIRRRQRGSEAKERPPQEQAPPEGPARGGAVHPLRQAAAG